MIMNYKHIELDHLAAALPNLDCFVTPDQARQAKDELAEVAKAIDQLTTYASLKEYAMHARNHNRINEASSLEGQCNNIYKQLPDWAKW